MKKMREKIISIFITACMLFSLMPQLNLTAAAAVWVGGTSATNWYDAEKASFTITTPEELAGFASLVNDGNTFSDKTVSLGANIFLNDVSAVSSWDSSTTGLNSWTPIGGSSSAFSGIFDGCGYTVSGIYISTTADYQALFGNVNGGTIKNVGVVDSYISGGSYGSGLIGYCENTAITNCYNTGSVTGISTNSSFIGGVAGRCISGTITDSYNTGSVSTQGSTFGGLVGRNESSPITRCYNTGSVTKLFYGSSNVGGLVGGNYGTSTMTNSYNTGSVAGGSSGTNAGGLVGDNRCTITNCYNAGHVSGYTPLGGIAGYNSGTVTSCYYDSQTSGVSGGINGSDAAGAVGKTTAWMKNATSTAGITGDGDTFENWDTAVWDFAADAYPQLHTIPYVLKVSPNGTEAGISGNLVITFSKIMYTTAGGAVSVSDGETSIELSAGTWSVDETVYTASYSGLEYATEYTVTISSFTDTNGNIMTGDSDHGFTTRAIPGIGLSETDPYTFAEEVLGYADGDLTPLSVTVTNTDDQATGDLTVALSGTNASSFTLSNSTISSIGAGGTATFTIKPNDSLTAGTYTATVTVSGSNVTSKSFTVSFTVNSYTGIWNGTSATSWYDAEKASFTITTPEELAGFASLVNDGNTFSDKTVSLGANIFLNDVSAVSSWDSSTTGLNSWTPIGGSSSTFNGTFDGCGYTVSGIYISTTADYQALFGNVNGGTIKNVGVVDSYISGGSYGSGLIGYCENTAITNCYNTGSVTGISTNSSFIGGVAGRCISGTITDSYNTGSVSTQGSTFGGLVGRNESSPITRCYNTGSVTKLFYGSSNVGGLVGGNYGTSTMTNSYNTGSVAGGSSGTNAGGLVGDNRCTITNCYNAGHVSGYTPLGGIAGYNSGTVTSCYYDSQTSGVSGGINGSDAAGAVGKTTAWMKNATSTAGITGDGGTFENWDTAVWDFAADAYPQLKTVSYGISLSQTAPYPFTAQTVGYSSVSPLNVTVTSTGNQATGALTVALSGTGKDCFTLSGATIGSIAASGTDTFTIKPNDSLTAGTYTATVTVSGSNVTSQSFTVSFTVESDTRSSAKAITGFTLSGVDGTISEANHTIAITLPYATDVTSLTPTITVSANANVSPASGTAQDFSSPVTYTVTAENESMQTYTVTVTVESDTRSSAKAITGFTLSGVDGTISETDHTIAVTLPYATDVTSLTPTITVSANATVSPASGTSQDFSSPVTYTVTAENESTQDYTVTVTVESDTRSSAKAITGFSIGGVNGTISETDHTIAVTLPYGTSVTSLTPTITVSDMATVSPSSGTAQDFSSPVTYTVTAENESMQTYTVTVTVESDTRSSAKAITGFTLSGVDGTISEANHTIAITLPYATDVTSLTPTITVSANATVSPASGTSQDFSSPVTYTVTAENESMQDYTVTVTVESDTRSSAKAITGFTLSGVDGTISETNHTIAITLPYGTDVTSLTPTVTVSDMATVSPTSGTAQDFTNPVTYTVTAENESTQDYTVTVTVESDTRSSAKAITGFTLSGVDGTISEANHTIAITLPYGTSVTSLTPTVTVSDKATVSPTSGTAQDFSSPVTYTVTAENESTQDYTVTVTVESDTRSSAKAITGFSIGGVNGTINETDHTIAVTLPYGTSVTSLTPTVTVSANATVSPTSGTAQDFSSPVTYTVTAENESTQDYTVTVTVESDTRSSAKAITGFTLSGVDGTISEANHTIAITLPYGTSVTSLTPTVTVSDKATVSPTSGTAQDFTNPVTYTVTAENESMQTYTVMVTVESDTRSSAKAITGFTLSGVDGTISETDHTIAVTLPYATDVTSLTPTITVSANATVSPASGTSQDFTNPVTYSVTAENESTQDYTVTVTVESDTRSSAKAITGFTLSGVDGTISETDHTIAITLPYATSVTSLTPTVTVSDKATVSPTSGTAQDFSSPVTYTVTAENESTQTYTVTVTVNPINTYSIGLSQTSTHTFTAQTAGYSSISPLTVTVSNTGNQATGDLTVALSGANASNFTLSKSIISSIGVGGTATFTVKPNDSMTAGAYTATVTVSGSNVTSKYFTVSFRVSSGSAGDPGGDSFSGSGSSSSSNSKITVTTENNITTASEVFTSSTSSDGVATASVTSSQISGMLAAAQAKAASDAQTAVELQVQTGSAATGVSVTLPQAAVSTLTGGEASLTVSSAVATVTLDSTTLAEIGKQTSGDVTITATAADTSALSADTKTAIGTRPVYDFKITSGSTTVSSFGGGAATVSVPYTPAAGEDVNAIVVYYIDASGELVTVPNCVYDAKTGTVTFTTTHFSTYAVGYNAVSFSDVSGSAWYADNVAYLAARNIIGGNNGAFSPDADITRAEFVTVLARMAGDDLSGYTTYSFSDVSTDSWYFAAVQWANKVGIASGYDGKFNPSATITREQMAAMLYRYAEYKGTVSNTEGMSVREFSDYDSISSWAQAPIQWAINNGILSGNTDGSFAPQSSATRAQAAKMLAVLMRGMVK